MGVFEMVVCVVFIGGVTGVIQEYLRSASRRGASLNEAAQTEIAALRNEVTELKTWANELILSFDSTLQQQNARLHSLEQRSLGPGSAAARAGLVSGESPTQPESLQTRV